MRKDVAFVLYALLTITAALQFFSINSLSPCAASLSKNAQGDLSVKGKTRSPLAKVLLPSADGLETYSEGPVFMDASHTGEGYVMLRCAEEALSCRLRIRKAGVHDSYYALHTYFEAFPLTAGDGSYEFTVWQPDHGKVYLRCFRQALSINLYNEYLPALYPNQYVSFSSDDDIVKRTELLAVGAKNDLEVVEAIFRYTTTHIVYDEKKASALVSGYIPSPDRTLHEKKGICIDIASMMTAMLRSQGIPTRLETGYAGSVCHAWISVHTEEQGWIGGVIRFGGRKWVLLDPTLALSQGSKNTPFYTQTTLVYTTRHLY